MAEGDAAAAAGMDVVVGTADLRNAYKEINKSRDYLADHQTGGTHDASAINAGTLNILRIPDIPPAKIVGGIDRLSGSGVTFTPGSGIYSASGGLAVAGDLVAGGSAAVGGGLSITGQITNPTAYGSVVSSGRTLAVRSDGTFGYFPSARRFKKNIKPARVGLDDVLALKPVEFDYKVAYGGGHDVGLIAEDVAEVMPWLVYDGDQDGQVDGIAYERLVVPLIAAVQQLAARVAELEGNS